MSWKKLLQSNKVHRHTTSRQELTEIRRLVARDLADAAIPPSPKIAASLPSITRRFRQRRWLSRAPDTESPACLATIA
jgi:hypothetical protein